MNASNKNHMHHHRSNLTLSVVLLSYQSAARLPDAVRQLVACFDREAIPFEIIIMDDGSRDASYQVALELEMADHRVRAYRLSRNYTSPFAYFAGLSVCRGGCATSVPDDLQRSPELVVRMYRKWLEGHQIVVPYRISRDDGRWSDLASRSYYHLMNRYSEVRFPPGGTDSFLADREVIDILNQRIRPTRTSPVVEVLRLGFDPVFVGYERPPTEGRSRWTLRKKLRLFSNTFFGASVLPLRLITVLGFVVFVVCMLLALAVIAAKLFSDNTLFGLPVQGWATTIVFITMFNGLILLCIGIVAEYIWRIFEEVKDRPAYIIRARHDDDTTP
jgi:polyisoprenyl-phosphate glycosyltransferase